MIDLRALAPLPLFAGTTQHVVLFSGGEGSALTAAEVVARYGREGVVLLNHDINPRVEDADIKRFKREVADALGLTVTQANHPRWDEVDQFDVVVEAGAFKGANGHVLCTNRLKSVPFEGWLDTYAPPGSVILYYGFGSHESDRIRRRATILGGAGYQTAYPLAHWKRRVHSTRDFGVEPPLTYSTFRHANCIGCLKAGRQHWFVVYCTRPDVWAKAKWAEDVIGYTIIDGTSLEELEPLFAQMLAAGVTPTERVPHQTFWADAKKRVRLAVVDAEAAAPPRPCDCSYRHRKGPSTAVVCTCLAPPGEPHRLHCNRVLGTDQEAA